MNKFYVGMTTLVLALAAVSGCTPAQNANVRQEVKGVRQQLDQAADQAREAAANATLAGKVKARLAGQKGLEGDHINVDAKNGTVILKGDVPNPNQAELAEQVAMGTEGVQAVENQLTMRVPATHNVPGPTTPNTEPGALPGPQRRPLPGD